MEFSFSSAGLKGPEKKVQRFFEILPGFTSWSIIIGMVFLSFYKPIFSAIVIIAFDLYWLMRLLYMTLFLVLSYTRLSMEKETDWSERVKELDNIKEYRGTLKDKGLRLGLKEKIALALHKKETEKLKNTYQKTISSEDIYQLVIIPVVKETREIIEPGIKSIAESSFPPERILVVIAMEERASEEVKAETRAIIEDHKNKFFDLLEVVHPDGIIGEAKVKGANTSYAAARAAEYLKEKNIPFENVIASCFDADTVVEKEYFAGLTYYYLTFPERERASFQPVPVYNNNIWEAPGITRVLETGSSFFQLIESTSPEKLVTFSSHSMSFKALVDIGYWPVDMISDDSAIFWKAFVHYDGDYHVVPMYLTLSMDAVVADSWWQTVVNVYKQRRRWAWGVENFPILMRAFLKSKKIPFFKKAKHAFKLFEGHIAWTTWAFLLSIIGWLPAIFATREFSHSVLYYSAPRIAGTIFRLASLSMIVSIILSLFLLPKRKEKNPILKRIGYAFQWLLIPFTIIFLSAIPALDAQTRMMLGKYMTFWVTDKSRGKK
ncbi:MAG: glycosyltransferase family 2 protein [Candidatus Omnitrophota bacterium]